MLWVEARRWLEGLLESGRIQRLRGYLAVNESRAAVCGHAAMIMADTSLVHVVHGVRGEPLQVIALRLPPRPAAEAAASGGEEISGLAASTAAREPLCKLCKLSLS